MVVAVAILAIAMTSAVTLIFLAGAVLFYFFFPFLCIHHFATSSMKVLAGLNAGILCAGITIVVLLGVAPRLSVSLWACWRWLSAWIVRPLDTDEVLLDMPLSYPPR